MGGLNFLERVKSINCAQYKKQKNIWKIFQCFQHLCVSLNAAIWCSLNLKIISFLLVFETTQR